MGSFEERSGPGTDRTPYTLNVVTAVAEAEGVDPTEIGTPLADAIDPTALEALLGRAETSARVTFCYRSLEVEVRSDGSVEVTDPSDGR